MSDRFDKDLREHLHREAEETREFPRALRGRIREGITPRGRAALMPQLALAGALVLVAIAVLAVRSPQVVINDVRSTVTQLFSTPSPAPTPQPFLCQDRSGGSTGITSQLTAVRVAGHEADGYDRIVFEFSGGIPSYDLTRQTSADFVRDPSGQPISLDGSTGLKLVLRDADLASGVAGDIKPQLASVKEIAQVGNFERVLTYGVGLSSTTCVRVLTLTAPSRLVIDVATTAQPSTTAAPTPLPTATAQASDLGPFSCQDQSGGSSTGAIMQMTALRVDHHPGFDRIVFEFTAPSGATADLPAYTLSRQASSTFVKDPSGLEVTLQGSNGLRIVFHGATAANSYPGSQDVSPGLPVVKEVEEIGDFEAVLSWGAGLSRGSCLRTLELANPTRLVIDIQTP
jgi:hypothetical protein